MTLAFTVDHLPEAARVARCATERMPSTKPLFFNEELAKRSGAAGSCAPSSTPALAAMAIVGALN